MRQTLIRLSLALMLSGAFLACAADAVTNISPTLPSTDAAGNPLLETNRAVDAQRVGLIGHSRLGKTVLWAGAGEMKRKMVVGSGFEPEKA